MSFEGQRHHPHQRGTSPSLHLLREAKDWIPSGLELVQATWYVRHGERTPVSRRMTGLAAIPATFNKCSVGREFATSVLQLSDPASRTAQWPFKSDSGAGADLSVGSMPVRRLSETPGPGHSTKLERGKMDCYWGQLTDIGYESTLSLGTALRSLYVDKLGFLPAVLPAESRPDSIVELRSTGMPRTIETLHQVAQGLFPVRDGVVEFVVRDHRHESLYPNSMCAQMKRLDQASAAKAAEKYNHTLEPLDAIISKYIDGAPVRIDGKPLASGILDTILSCRAHDIPFPAEFDSKTLSTIEAAVVHEWFDSYQSHEFKRLAMGRLLGDLRSTMERKVVRGDEEKLKISINACHDTSLAGILNALDVFDQRWPPFTSSISFELLKQSSTVASPPAPTSTPHFVRMRFNHQVLVPPSCKTVEGLCTWDEFKAAVKDVEMTNEEWQGITDAK